jgi:hypothetical protein
MFEALKEKINLNSVSKDASRAIVGYEGLDEFTKQKVQTSADAIESAIVEGFEELKHEGFQVTDAQIEAAKKAALMAVDPVNTIKALSNNRVMPEVGAEGIVVTELAFDKNDIVPNPGFEAFDSQNVVPSVHFSVLFNAMVMKQDDVAELFFPIVPVDPKSSGATVSMVIDSVIRDFTRNPNGNPNRKQFDKTPLVKIVNDPDKIDIDKNRLVPVLRTTGDVKNDDKFVSTLAKVVNYNGENVTTAPLKVNQEVGLIAISQTDSMLAKGIADETDALDANVRITAIYGSLYKEDSKGNKTYEYFKFDTSNLPAHFTYSTRDLNKDIILNLDTTALGLTIGKTLTATGAQSQILAGLPENYTVQLRLALFGNGNTQYGDIAVYVTKFEMVGLYDAAGNKVPETSDVYQQVADVFKTLQAEGYDVEAYLTNTNARMRGLIVTSDKYTEVFTVPYRTGITLELPVVINGDDGDVQYLNTQINVARQKMNMAAFKTLDGLINYLQSNDVIDTSIVGVSDKLVNKWFLRETLDLQNVVDSMNSNTRDEDIRKALALRIRNAALKAYLESNYGIALSTLRPDVKPTIIIGTDPIIGAFLAGAEEFLNDPNFNYVIKTSVNPLIRGKVVFSFGIFDGNRNKAPEPLNFGQCFYAPEIVINVIKTINGAARSELTTMPRFRHVPNLPILGVFDITNIESVLGKVPVETKAV